jgi:hypothetical protein
MKVYLAGPWVARGAMPSIARQLESEGHAITERWWEKEEPGNVGSGRLDDKRYLDEHPELITYFEERAVADFIGVVNADALVVWNSDKSEGKAVETGIALAHKAAVVVIGKRTNVFHHLPGVHVVDTVDDALALLRF